MRFFSRLCGAVIVGLLATYPLISWASTDTPTVDLPGRTVSLNGIAVSKSSIVRLADLNNDRLAMIPGAVYVPAGTLVALFDVFATDLSRRRWQLGLTEDGLFTYSLASSRLSPTEHLNLKNGKFAIAQRQFETDLEDGPRITITASEIYGFEYLQGNRIRIEVGPDKLPGEDRLYYANVSINDFGIVTQYSVYQLKDQLTTNPLFFTEYDIGDELSRILKAVEEKHAAEGRQALSSLASRKFVSRKECNVNIDLTLSVGGELGLDLSGFLSPLDAKLGISGSYTSQTVFPQGLAFIA